MLWLLGLLVVTACTQTPASPWLEPNDRPFAGIDALSARASVVRLIMIHGACHREGAPWLSRNRQHLADYLAVPVEPVTRILDDPDTRIQLYKTSLHVAGRVLELYGIVFSEATRALKQRYLCQAGQTPAGVCSKAVTGETDVPARRSARLNGRIKNWVLNDCVADTVFYLGTAGETIRRGVRHALNAIHADAGGRVVPTLLLSKSLGSKILRDAVLCARPDESLAGLAQLSGVTTVFLNSNQIALLNNATVQDCASPALMGQWDGEAAVPAQTGGIIDLIRLLPRVRERLQIREGLAVAKGPIEVVAFSDPNDLLSYEVKPALYGDFPVINAWVRNRRAWFGLFADPVGAHMGYLENPVVLDTLFCGHLQPEGPLCRR